jgi:hypothetical protein
MLNAQQGQDLLHADQFEEVSQALGLTGEHFSWGSAWGDPNGDGRLDLFLGNHFRAKDHNEPFLLYQQPDGTFLIESLPYWERVEDMHGSAWIDVDNDGDVDFYGVTGRASCNLFLRNHDGVLMDETESLYLGFDQSRGRTPIFWDVNADHRLDLVVTNGPPMSSVMRNNSLIFQRPQQFVPSLADSVGAFGQLTSTGAVLADPFGAGNALLGIPAGKRMSWWMPGCDALEEIDATSIDKTIHAIAGDFNNDARSDLYLVRNYYTQSTLWADYPMHTRERYGIQDVDPASFSVLADAKHGQMQVNASGEAYYTPDPGFSGLDSAKIRGCDLYDDCEDRVLTMAVGVPVPDGLWDAWTIPVDGQWEAYLPDVWQPYPHQLLATLFIDQGSMHGFDFRIASDTVRLQFSPYNVIPNADIRIGSSGWHPEGSNPFHLKASDPDNWGLSAMQPGDEDALVFGYDPANAMWQVRMSNAGLYRKTELSFMSSVVPEIVATYGFDTVMTPLPDQLLLSTEHGFVDATGASPFGQLLNSVGAVAGDYDNDGDLDLFVACTRKDINLPNHLFMNLGDGSFEAVPMAGGTSGTSRGSSGMPSVADFDADGDLDIFLGNGRSVGSTVKGPYELFRNKGNSNHWVRIDLQGSTSNREGIGSVVHLWSKGQVQMRVSDGGLHRMAQNDHVLHFGLGASERIDSVIVYWPSGIRQEVKNLQPDQLHVLVEPAEGARGCSRPFGLSHAMDEAHVQLQWMEVPCSPAYAWEIRDKRQRVVLSGTSVDPFVSIHRREWRGKGPWTWRVRATCYDGNWGGWSMWASIANEDFYTRQALRPTGENPWRLEPNAVVANGPQGVWCRRLTGLGEDPSSSNESRLVLLDVQGRVHWSYQGALNDAQFIPTATLPAGSYWVQVQAPDGAWTMPLLVLEPR